MDESGKLPGWACSAWHWAWEHRIEIVDTAALAVCLIPAAGTIACVIGQGLAYSFRSGNRFYEDGFNGTTISASVVDLSVTAMGAGAGVGIEKNLEEVVPSSLRQEGIRVITSQGDIVVGALGWAKPGNSFSG